MKKITLISVAIIFGINSFAQQEISTIKDFELELSIGFNKPLGKYLYKFGTDNEGFAKNGLMLNFAVKQNFNNFFGLKFSVGAMINPVNSDYFHLNVFLPDVRAEFGKWFNIVIAAGPYFYLLSKDNIFELSLSPCLINAGSPPVFYARYDNNLNEIVYKNEYARGNGLSLGVNPEFSLIQDIASNKKLKIFFNYLLSKSNIEYENRVYFKDENDEYKWVTHEKNKKRSDSSYYYWSWFNFLI